MIDAAAFLTFITKWAWLAFTGLLAFMFKWSHARHSNTYTKEETDKQVELRQAPLLEMLKQQKESNQDLKTAINEQTAVQREFSARIETVVTSLAITNNELKHK